MPRDLFGDVTRPSISVGNRKWYTVPVSLLSHTLVLAMIVIVPILAAPMMPGVLDNSTLTRFIDIVPPTPPPPPKRDEIRRVDPAPDPRVAPIDAPTGFKPEPLVPFEGDRPPISTIAGGVSDGDPSALAPPPAPKVVAPPPKPVQVGGAVRRPVQVKSVQPIYPTIAQSARVQGIVIIEATIDEHGRVTNMRVLRSIPLLEQAALDAVRQWEYMPTTLNGVPVPVIMTVTVNFTLQ